MAFCGNCGAAIPENVRFCPQCGREAGAAAPASAPGGTAAAGGLTSNVAGLLCYAGWFVTGIVFLVLEPYNRDPFVRFHAFQSIFYTVASIILLGVVSWIPFLGGVFAGILWFGFMALWVVLMLQAYQQKKWKLPVIGDLAEKQG